MIKFSLIIPVYNTEKYLGKCLDSVVNQWFKNFEALVINDGSTDGSLSIINSYANNYDFIKVINKKNTGLSDSRNLGVSSSVRWIHSILRQWWLFRFQCTI